jgi:hypothetical protein
MPLFWDFSSLESLYYKFCLHDAELRRSCSPRFPIRGDIRIIDPDFVLSGRTVLYGARNIRCDSTRLAIVDRTCSCAVFFTSPAGSIT